MKFHLLPIGQAFAWQGTAYSKSGPVTATDHSGNSRMVPRSASVEPLSATAPPEQEQQQAPEKRLSAAHAAYRSALLTRIQALADRLSPGELAALTGDLDRLERTFLQQAGIGTPPDRTLADPGPCDTP